ncbi:hypothetical protein ACT3UD_09355 [Glutamicibacter sp. 287]|uniref:hypothetical protein n=1 Tax=unclassified Glutamicibacter TaxID=2627139 RepID=UPI001142677A|nr:hypothetical protein [Glutamicibacter sp. BW80]
MSTEELVKKLAPLPLVVALSLAGCTAYEVTPGPRTMPAVEKGTEANTGSTELRYYANELTTPEDPQQWADEKINQYLNGRGARSFAAFKGWTPQHGTIGWESPETGLLVITVQDAYWVNLQAAHSYAEAVMSGVGYESPELQRVTLTTQDGSNSVTILREDVPGLY